MSAPGPARRGGGGVRCRGGGEIRGEDVRNRRGRHASERRARGAPQAQGRVERHARATPSTARVGVRPSQARAGGRRICPRPSPAARGRDATGRDVDLTLKKPTDFARRAGARPHSSASRLATHLHGRRDHRGGHGERESHGGRGVWSSTTDRARICGAFACRAPLNFSRKKPVLDIRRFSRVADRGFDR